MLIAMELQQLIFDRDLLLSPFSVEPATRLTDLAAHLTDEIEGFPSHARAVSCIPQFEGKVHYLIRVTLLVVAIEVLHKGFTARAVALSLAMLGVVVVLDVENAFVLVVHHVVDDVGLELVAPAWNQQTLLFLLQLLWTQVMMHFVVHLVQGKPRILGNSKTASLLVLVIYNA